MKTYTFTPIAENVPSKHLKKMRWRLLPVYRAFHLYEESVRLRDRKEKETVQSLSEREWTDPNYGLSEW